MVFWQNTFTNYIRKQGIRLLNQLIHMIKHPLFIACLVVAFMLGILYTFSLVGLNINE